MHSIGASIYLEVELENTLEEISVIQLELEKEFGGTGPHLEVELESVSITMVATVYDLSCKEGPYAIFTSLQENIKMYILYLYKPLL